MVFIRYVALGESLYLLKPQIPHFKNGINDDTRVMGLLGALGNNPKLIIQQPVNINIYNSNYT